MIKALSLLLLSVLTVKAGVGAGCSSVRYTPLSANVTQYCETTWSTNDGSGRIAGMKDLSGNGYDFIGGGTTQNPTWTNNAANNRAAAMFQSALSKVFTNKIFLVSALGDARIYAAYIVKSANTTANIEVWTAAGTTTNRQMGCDAGSAGLKFYDGSHTNTTAAIDMSSKFFQVNFMLGGITNGLSLILAKTNNISCSITDSTVLVNDMQLGSFGRILTVYGDFYYCASALWHYEPPDSQKVLCNEYLRASFGTY